MAAAAAEEWAKEWDEAEDKVADWAAAVWARDAVEAVARSSEVAQTGRTKDERT